MRETIILAPSAGNSELLRTLARFEINSIGVRVLSRVELSKLALMRSGITVTEEFLTSKEEPSVIFSFLKDIGYFKAPSFSDAESMAKALTTVRSLIPADEENELKKQLSRGEFADKNAAIIEAYDQYIAKCIEDNRIDSISLVRKAIREAEAVSGAEFRVLSEFPLTPLDHALIESVSGGKYEEISLIDLLNREKTDLRDIVITEGYGHINEVEDIISDIFRNEIPLDQCIIASTDTSSYSQIIYDLSCRYDIPVSYGCGVPILNSNPARLLKLIYEWRTTGYYGIDALRKIISSDAFDRSEFEKSLGVESGLKRRDIEELVKMAGNLRLSFNGAVNRIRIETLKKVIEKEYEDAKASGISKNIKRAEYRSKVLHWTEKLAEELAKGCILFLSKYVLIRTDATSMITESAGRIDQSAIKVIIESLEAYMRYEPDGDINDIIPEILNKTVCSENSREGYLHVTSLTGALSCMRKNLYVCGLGAQEFPGTPAENYLLLDSDLELFADEDTAPTSENKIKRNKKALDDLLNLAAALNVRIRLSYSGYSLSELKERNPSSVLFNIYERMYPDRDMDDFRKNLRQAPYFGSGISSDHIIGDEYCKGAEFTFDDRSEDKSINASALSRAWSPSALSNFIQCPRHFYLANILGIPEDEPDDPFVVLNPAVIGSLAHSMMEMLAAQRLSRNEFLKESAKVFDEALDTRPPLHNSDAVSLKRDFLRMMETAYDTDPHNSVLSAEEEFSFTHPSGIRLHGYPDRVEQDDGGRFIIADFKTKWKIEHEQDDFSSCMQVVVYAWLCEQAGIDISSCEYRYLRKGKTVTCKYNEDMKQELSVFLEELKDAIENNDFPRTENKISCKYCNMNGICKWTEDEREEGSDE